ncbi:MAG: DUF2344 domain-containing protein [Ruminiclostridium sp.]|nr:DUF2344 domain-containing protein [Ruminiclostridium sp.]
MNNIRIRFTRGDNVKFISHLDMIKLFERTLRRTGLPIAYSQGFNPHPQMVFGLPLSVGVTSEAEYADFELSENMEPSEFLIGMNRELPAGIVIKEAVIKTAKGNIMASVSGAAYLISIFLNESLQFEEINNRLNYFLEKKEINIKKEGKGGIKDVNIQPMIHKLEVYPLDFIPQGYEGFETVFCMEALLNAGSVSNLKPELLLTAFLEKTGIEIGAAKIHRKALYVDKDGKMASPMEVV